MKKGQKVRLVQPIIEGEIQDTQYNKTHEELEHLVPWTDADGNEQTRYFLESQLELVGAKNAE